MSANLFNYNITVIDLLNDLHVEWDCQYELKKYFL